MPPFKAKLMEKLGIAPLAQTLFKKPQKETKASEPNTNVYHKNAVHQADLIFLPHDKIKNKTYKYALVVVDLATGLTDAEPLTDKSAAVVTAGLKKIYSRSILGYPNRMETDPGSEFKSNFAGQLKSKGIELRYGKTGRHRQQSVAENRNYAIGYALNLRMVSIEEMTGETSRDWVSFLPTVIKALNEQVRERKPKPDPAGDSGKPANIKDLPDLQDISNSSDSKIEQVKKVKLLEVGTRVRVILEEPVDNVSDKKLHGKFRAGDRRWDPKIRKIHQQIVRPDQPVMYTVTNPDTGKPDKVAYTIEQLQVVTSNEREPEGEKLLSKEKISSGQFRVHSINGKKGNKYLVRWIGFPDKKYWTWEPKSNLMKGGEEVKQKILDFDL